MKRHIEESQKLENRARCSLRFGHMCDKMRGKKDWALDAKLRAWRPGREAPAPRQKQ